MFRKQMVTILSVCLGILAVSTLWAQDNADLEGRVHKLVLRHHFHGIQYSEAKALGRNAIPILLRLLEDEGVEQFWVNTVVTLGFIESSDALDPLLRFLYSREGEVGVETYRALAAVPFAVGCIASNGDLDALAFLEQGTEGLLRPGWRFGSKDPTRVLAGKSVIALAVSGQPRAEVAIERLEREVATGLAASDLADFLTTARKVMSRLQLEPRAAVFNPKHEQPEGGI